MKKSKRTPKILTLSKETIARLSCSEDIIQLPVITILTGSTLEACLTTSLDTTG